MPSPGRSGDTSWPSPEESSARYASMPEARSAATSNVDLSLQSPNRRRKRLGGIFRDQPRIGELHAGVAHLAMQAFHHLGDVLARRAVAERRLEARDQRLRVVVANARLGHVAIGRGHRFPGSGRRELDRGPRRRVRRQVRVHLVHFIDQAVLERPGDAAVGANLLHRPPAAATACGV